MKKDSLEDLLRTFERQICIFNWSEFKDNKQKQVFLFYKFGCFLRAIGNFKDMLMGVM